MVDIGDHKIICTGNTPLELFMDIASTVRDTFQQICENNWESINSTFDLDTYKEMFAESTCDEDQWTWRDLVERLPRLLAHQENIIREDARALIRGEWSDLIKWVTDDLRNGDGIQLGPELDTPDFARWLREWEQD